jgi:hypothetical protein
LSCDCCFAEEDLGLPDELGIHVGEDAVHVECNAQGHSSISRSERRTYRP